VLAAVFVSAIYWLAFVTATSATATPEEKKWAMSVLSAGAAGLVGYLVRK
jgi:NADPH:quinone reductase-like Zn-dependent oxidoreductase